ncbi:TetR/AcrR family transcriptional regulator [Allostreptomyces psammosilenae]|uniref:AcrR family transcriptional regulator n=1 Tax=Allostreptomyces psammosilenae TaxID=1892865 RepID=A0A853A2L7_9ACTN|nr:TetR/AcrR family transcriptional regulator [Allostreptomyces psammosilenae]NYI07124.1 AcrR family transcriptional regulator [Allostreptomyces psammosilenae]
MTSTPSTRPAARGYHHGDLRRALLRAAVELIAERGTSAVSLRDLARRAGVSHAAPAHHFGDKAGLFTAIAAEGYRLLATSLTEALATTPTDLRELGVRYVRFAIDHPAHFEVMFRTELLRPDDPELRAAQDDSGRALRAGLPERLQHAAPERAGRAAWSLAHGFATLWLTGNLRAAPGEPEPDPADAFRDIASMLFTDPTRPQ